jgi:hypothetical protein
MPAPILDDDLGLGTISEPLHCQAFITELAIEAFIGAVLPWLAWVDQCTVDTLSTMLLEQLAHALFDLVGLMWQLGMGARWNGC